MSVYVYSKVTTFELDFDPAQCAASVHVGVAENRQCSRPPKVIVEVNGRAAALCTLHGNRQIRHLEWCANLAR